MKTASLPFELRKDQSFYESLNEWLGDLFYDELPELGFEIRDEQIFMTFQIEHALKTKRVLLAEAGVGTGKTLAYLLPILVYSMYTGKPAIIACSDERLIDQLVKKEGDLKKVEQLLQTTIDVRLAKSMDQYICLKRLDEAAKQHSIFQETQKELPPFVYSNGKGAELTPYGDRSEYPHLSDEQWNQINYHSIYQCETCELKNRCGQTLHRAHYRNSMQLIVCSHDFLVEHVWTKDSRKRQGQLPLLPEMSAIVLDEGHLLEEAAQRAMSYAIQQQTFAQLIDRIASNGTREETLHLMDDLLELHDSFFSSLMKHSTGEDDKRVIQKNEMILTLAQRLKTTIISLLDEFVFESELQHIDSYDLAIFEEYLEQYEQTLNLFLKDDESIEWLEQIDDNETLMILPASVDTLLESHLFSKNLPIIFSSATLSNAQDFYYLANNIGIADFDSFHVDSPFSYDEVMKIQGYEVTSLKEKRDKAIRLLKQSSEQTLWLFKNTQSMHVFKQWCEEESINTVRFEGEKSLTSLIEDFQNQQMHHLAAVHLWEGIDLPREQLTQVVLMDLPFPTMNPILMAKHAASFNPYEDIDLPHMLLRYQQGIGRLIRTADDFGTVHVFVNEEERDAMASIENVSPVAIQWEK